MVTPRQDGPGDPEPPDLVADADTLLGQRDAAIGPTQDAQGGRFLPSGDEAGSAPEDRAFRPDIEGLRAVAVLLVMSDHLGINRLPAGFIGVDVFFVISGFVITGILLRERVTTGRTRLLTFYGRRARRIIPLAVLVIVMALFFLRLVNGAHAAELVAPNARWAALFLANMHPELLLGTYWSLAVEEQFYLVYPALFILVCLVGTRWSIRTKLGVFLALVVGASYVWSGISTSTSFFAAGSALTRAWELAVGGLLALSTPMLKRLPTTFAAVITWVGLGGLLLLLVKLDTTLPYPGWVAVLPVAAAALIIGGGTAVPRYGTEALLRLAPFKWLGRWSYSIYLWHLPVIILGIQYLNNDSLPTRLGLAVFSVALSAGTYFAFENPIRHSKLLTQNPPLSVVMGLLLIAACLGLVTLIA
jgi:peptidoglycan/LPS O-acetylase OafA/YrhL